MWFFVNIPVSSILRLLGANLTFLDELCGRGWSMNFFLFPESMWILNRLHCSMIYSTCSPPFSSRWGLLYLLVRVKSCKIKKKLLILCILSKKKAPTDVGVKLCIYALTVHICLFYLLFYVFFFLFSLPCLVIHLDFFSELKRALIW